VSAVGSTAILQGRWPIISMDGREKIKHCPSQQELWEPINEDCPFWSTISFWKNNLG